MTYLAGLHVIEVKGLFYADWLTGRQPAASPVGTQLREEEAGKSGNMSCTIGELLAGLAGSLDSAQAESKTATQATSTPNQIQ